MPTPLGTSLSSPPVPPAAAFADQHLDEFNACLDALEAQLAFCESVDSRHIETFLADVARIGPWAPVLPDTLQTHDFRMSLAYCHIASFRAGRSYLMNVARNFPVEIGQRSLQVLQSLTPEAREEMLGQGPRDSRNARIGYDGLILLTIPGTRLGFPMMPACVSDAQGGVTAHEMRQLLDMPLPCGRTLHQTLSSVRSRMSREEWRGLSDWHAEQGHRYMVAALPEWAAAQYSKACVAALDANDWSRTSPLVGHFLSCVGECASARTAALVQGELINAFEMHGFNATAAEVAWALVDLAHDRFGPPEAACAMRALAERLWDRAGVTSAQYDPDTRNRDLIRGIREVIGAHVHALASSGLSHASDSIRCDAMRDIYSFVAFDPSDEREWCLMRRTSKWQADSGIWDVILEETATSILKGARHPWTHEPMCLEDVIVGPIALDLLRLASRVGASRQAGMTGDGEQAANARVAFE